MKTHLFQAVLPIVLIVFANECRACTTFVLSDGNAVLFARNLDWYWGDGMVVVNPRNIQKMALVQPQERPASWTSKYGSVTFNQFGREMPFGGINEVGLVVEQMMLFESQYPEPDDRPAINMLQWIQFQLDNYQTVDEVISSDAILRQETPQGQQKIHYLICDASGDAATIEFLEGKMVVHHGDTLAAKALANDTFQKSAEFMRSHSAGTAANGMDSLHRFTRAAKCSIAFQSRSPEENREYGFRHLSDVAQGQFTVWSIVYDISNRKVFYRTRDDRDLRWFSLDDFDYSSSVAPGFLDIDAQAIGHIASDFQELTEDRHRKYLDGFFGKEDVKKIFGDLTPLAEGLQMVLMSYRPSIQE